MTGPTSIGFGSSISDISMDDLGPNTSVQLAFAKLQLAQSKQCKDRSLEYMDRVKGIQLEQQKTADMISQARQQLESVKNGGTAGMTPELKAFFDSHKNLAIAGNKGTGGSFNKDEWEVNLKSLTNYQESVGSETQTLMVYLQDFIGQYNSFLQGANTSISTANQVLTQVARGQ